MKWSLAFASVLGVSLAHAEGPAVKITSFVMAGSRTRAAELCGQVTGATAPIVVRVVVDPKEKKPGIYNVMADKDGLFCTTVVTYTGTASASAWVGEKIDSAQVTASNAEERR